MTADHWSTIESIFHDALAQPEGERLQFVRERAAGDRQVVTQVESLLAAHLATTSDDASPLIGKRVGDYRIVREIGRGGMGAIYLAVRDDDAFRKQVAIKVIKRGMDSDAIVRRFRNERQILADLDHPNIARLLDGGTTEDGLPFFVMEFIDGLPLDRYCDDRALGLEERLRLFGVVCDAVAYASGRGVVHRDLKPSNILVMSDGTPHLVDFGIAKVLNTDSIDVTASATAVGQQIFTPAYASPEQLRGELVSPASDVYSLGVIAYELLTGRRPWARPDAAAKGTETPPLPSVVVGMTTTETRSKSRKLRGDLDRIVLMAIERDPARRYQTAAELGQDIGRHLRGEVVRARPQSPLHRAARRLRRHRSVIAAVAVLLAVLLIPAVWRFVGLSPAPRASPVVVQDPGGAERTRVRIAVLPFQQRGGSAEDTYLRVGLADALIARLSAMANVEVRPTAAVLRYQAAGTDALTAARELRVDEVVSGGILRDAGRVRVTVRMSSALTGRELWSSDFDEPEMNTPELQSSIAERIASHLAPRLQPHERASLTRRRTSSAEADRLYWKAHFILTKAYRSPEDLTRAASFLSEATALDPSFALAWAELARCHELGSSLLYMPPRVTLPRAREAALRALAIDDSLSDAHSVLAMVLWEYDWDWDGAERQFRIAIGLNPSDASAHQRYAEFLNCMQRHDEAIAETTRAQEVDPLAINYRAVEALILLHARQYENAIAAARATLEMDANSYISLMYMGAAYDALGDHANALKSYLAAQRLSGGAYPDIAMLARTYALAGRSREYRATLRKLEQMSEKSFVDPYAFAIVYAAAREKEKAIAALRKSCDERSFWVAAFRVDPSLDPIRGEPEFQEIVRGLRFPAPRVARLEQ